MKTTPRLRADYCWQTKRYLWEPTEDSELVAEWNHYDMPLSGYIRQGEELFAFDLLMGDPATNAVVVGFVWISPQDLRFLEEPWDAMKMPDGATDWTKWQQPFVDEHSKRLREMFAAREVNLVLGWWDAHVSEDDDDPDPFPSQGIIGLEVVQGWRT